MHFTCGGCGVRSMAGSHTVRQTSQADAPGRGGGRGVYVGNARHTFVVFLEGFLALLFPQPLGLFGQWSSGLQPPVRAVPRGRPG